jgi:ectoine hydroxylase-related dioxygenase (phytanoyl-CoA dioxygenase family)
MRHIEDLRRDGFAIVGEIEPSLERGALAEILRECLDSYDFAFPHAANNGLTPFDDIIHHRRYWHVDRPLEGARTGYRTPPLAAGGPCWINVIWADVDFTRENGATHMVAGSHLRPEVRRSEFESVQEYSVIEMPRGSAAIWIATHVLHRAGENQTGRPRPSRVLRICGLWKAE